MHYNFSFKDKFTAARIPSTLHRDEVYTLCIPLGLRVVFFFFLFFLCNFCKSSCVAFTPNCLSIRKPTPLFRKPCPGPTLHVLNQKVVNLPTYVQCNKVALSYDEHKRVSNAKRIYIYVYKLYSHMHKGRRNGSERGGGESGESVRWREAGIEMGSG